MPLLALEAEAVFFDFEDFVREFIDEVLGDVPGEDEAIALVVAVFPVAFDAAEDEGAFVGVIGDVVGEDGHAIVLADAGGDEAADLATAAAFDGEDVVVLVGEFPHFAGAVAIAFVHEAALDGDFAATAEGDGALDQEVDLVPGHGFAVVDDDHVSGCGVGEDAPFDGGLLDVAHDGDEDGGDGADAAAVGFFAEAEDVFVAELAALFFHGLAEAVLDEGGELIEGFLGLDPFDCELAPGDEVGVEVGDLHAPFSGGGFGVGGAPFSTEEHAVFFFVGDGFFAELAFVVGI